jgi:superfamily II DNA/RNA helicase
VVATPARLGQHIEAATLRLTQCQAVVLDEADVLLGDAYAFSQQVNTRVPKPGGMLSLSGEHAKSQTSQTFQEVF